ncbi:MAG TPA: aminotransferase class V-fold PLP-dependent enzyme [Phycisphaerae bacterium]|nr:aminotransferase class V-fold PLP-dependent enzyme [Phycisphaerae bacterium]
MSDRLYLDNAATSFPKPPEVMEAMRAYAETLGASAGRGAYREAVETGELVTQCRRAWARLISAPAAESIIFTLNCSEALNLAIKGIVRPGDHVVATAMDHNSVLRPLNGLAARDEIDLTIVPARERGGGVRAQDVISAVRAETRLVCLPHASNVTGAIQPVEEIVARLRQKVRDAHSTLILLDAAQTAGHLPIDVQALDIDFLAMPGHKGWLGPLGTGGLYIRPGLEKELRPLMEGGTGSISENPMQPDFLPDKFESGSHNAIGIAGLGAGLAWIEKKTVAALREHDLALSKRFLERAAEIGGLTIYGPLDARERTAVFSIRLADLEPAELSALLDTEFGILSRSGLHCAPLAHEAIGTSAVGGTTRLSFGAFNTLADVDRCAAALGQLAAASVAS